MATPKEADPAPAIPPRAAAAGFDWNQGIRICWGAANDKAARQGGQAEEYLGEAFLSLAGALKAWDPKRGSSGFLAWRVYQDLRGRARDWAHADATPFSQLGDQAPDPPDSGPSSIDVAIGNELQAYCLAGVKRWLRPFVRARLIEGRSVAETARELGILPKTVWMGVCQARRKLRKLLEATQ